MTNPKEIEISQIKNLNLIYFYVLEPGYIGLNIVYDDNKNLNYDYTYEYFEFFVAKVVKTYKEESKIKKIQFLDKNSEEIMDKFCSKELDIQEQLILQEKNTKYNSRNLDTMFLKEYIIRMITLFLKCMEDSENIEIKVVKKYRDGYNFIYNTDSVLPLKIVKQDEFSYLIKFRYVNKEVSISFNGDIKIYKDCIAINYVSSDKCLEGKNIYHIENQKNIEEIKYNGITISYENNYNQIINREIINFYLKLLGLPLIEQGIKTTDNNYLLIETKENEKYFIHISISKNYVCIIVNKSIGIQKDELFVPLEQTRCIINVILEDKNLVIEKHYLDTPISTGYYKKNLENKYSYETYRIDSDDLTKSFNIINANSKR